MALWMVHTSPLLNMLAFLMRIITITSMRATQLFVRLLWITWSCLLVCLWHFLDSQITIHKFFASLCFMFKPNIMGYLVHKEATKMELPLICWQKVPFAWSHDDSAQRRGSHYFRTIIQNKIEEGEGSNG
jgi:hypothetical protein